MKINIVKSGNGQPLVLLHGWGFDHRIWQPLLPLLSHKFSLYLIDLSGFGLTPFMSWNDFKKSLLEQLPKNFAVVGWSLGGLYATRLAVEANNHVTHLCNIASSPKFIKAQNWPGIDNKVLEAFYHDVVTDPMQKLNDFIKLQLPYNALPFRYNVPQINLHGMQAGLEVLTNWDLRDDLCNLNIPVYYIFGRRDAIISRHTLAVMRNYYPQFHYKLYKNAAHMPFLSHREEIAAEFEGFLT